MFEQNSHIEMKSITKIFGSLKANDSINLNIKKGEVHAILGENGAGKSTLMNILTGIYLPDEGSISIGGKNVVFRSPQDSIRARIGMIYQHFKLVDAMTAWENICAGPAGASILRPAIIKNEIQKLSDETGLYIDLNKVVRDMGVGEKQTLEIIKVLFRGADILILDEPTTVLTPQETETLFSIIQIMKDSGKTIIIITHKLYEVMSISDRVTILRKGKHISTVNTSEVTQKQLAELMVGQSMNMAYPSVSVPKGPRVMKIRNLNIYDEECNKNVKDISFDLFEGEILGIAGVSGSGQKQICQGLVGLQKIDSGEVWIRDHNIAGLSSREILAQGQIKIGFVPEDRVGMGLIAGLDLVENVILKDYRKNKGLFLDRKAGIVKTEDLVDALEIMHPGINRPIRVLSGGNMQKVLIGREIKSNPDVLIAAYPVRGLDLGVTHKVIDLLNEQKSRGTGILLAAEDLDLMMEICDRILILFCGQVSGIIDTSKTSKEELGIMMSSHPGECSDD